MSDMSPIEAARQFLDAIHPDNSGRLEMRFIDPRTGYCTKSWPASNEQAARIAMEKSPTTNVYFGVAGRKDSTSGNKHNVAFFPGAPVDVDFKDFAHGENEAWERMNHFLLKPTIIVHTGGGLHCYFLLLQPIPVTAEVIASLEDINKAFAKGLGGDKCHSIDHLFRIPGTTNWPDAKKRSLGRKPMPVRPIIFNGPRYTIGTLQRASQAIEENIVDHSGKPEPDKGKQNGLPVRFLKLLETDAQLQAIWNGKREDLKDQSGSGYDMALTNYLVKHSFTASETKAIMTKMPNGRGANATDAYHNITIKKANLPYDEPLSPANLADRYLIDRHTCTDGAIGLRYHKQQWMRYDRIVFKLIDLSDIQADVATYLQSTRARHKVTTSFVSNVILNMQARCSIPSTVNLPAFQSGMQWKGLPHAITMENGIVLLENLKSNPPSIRRKLHTARFVSTTALPFIYDPTAQCPRWLAFLEQILPDPPCRQLLSEIFGNCLTTDTRQQKFFMFEGPGGNGKGVVTDILIALVGTSNISSLPLEQFAATHGLEATLGKLVNITSEIGDLDRVAEGLLKQFTGGDTMHFNPKYRNPYSAKPTAKLVIATNVHPPFRDRSEGIWRRLILLPFMVHFPESEQNKNLAIELCDELPGIFNWAIRGHISLAQRGFFLEPKVCVEAKRVFRLETNPARTFLEQRCMFNGTSRITTRFLYNEYKDFCEIYGYRPLNNAHFGREVYKAFPNLGDKGKLTTPGSKQRVPTYYGLRLFPGVN